jgi:hypothetical protein
MRTTDSPRTAGVNLSATDRALFIERYIKARRLQKLRARQQSEYSPPPFLMQMRSADHAAPAEGGF